MDRPYSGDTGNLEDQIRRMILNENNTNAPQAAAVNAGQPTVRLPSSAAYGPSFQTHGPPTPQRYSQHTQWQAQSPPGQPPLSSPTRHSGFHQRYGNIREPNMQSPTQLPGPPLFNQNQRARFQQQVPLDPDAFQRRNIQGPQQLFNPNQPRGPPVNTVADQHARQSQYLEQLATFEIRDAEMSAREREEKDVFRMTLQRVCEEVCAANPERLPQVSLHCFGSFQSGFATAGSDMDLVIVVDRPSHLNAISTLSSDTCFSLLEQDLPRVLEKRLLQLSYGARLLTRTRVPIIKVCQSPDDTLLDKLRTERDSWDVLPDEKKYPHLYPAEDINGEEHAEQAVEGAGVATDKVGESASNMSQQEVNQGQKTGYQQATEVQVNPRNGAAPIKIEWPRR